MKTISFGQRLNFLFNFAAKKSALTKFWDKEMLLSLVGAFFIVLVMALVLNFFQSNVLAKGTGTAVISEPVAFLPGQLVTSSLLQEGYITR